MKLAIDKNDEQSNVFFNGQFRRNTTETPIEMRKPEITTTRFLLILLGVIVAIIVSINTSAFGMEEVHGHMLELPKHNSNLLHLTGQIGKEIFSLIIS